VSSAEPIAKSLPILRVVGQMANTYIIAEGPDGMYLIDQHAAHERVLFEKIRNERSRRAIEIQGLLQPVPVELTVRQQELMESQAEALSEYGFSIEHFGERTYLVRSVPALLIELERRPRHERRLGHVGVDREVEVSDDALVVDCAHGHNLKVVQAVKEIRGSLELDVVAGNIATQQAARDLVGHVDGLKVGLEELLRTGERIGAQENLAFAYCYRARLAIEAGDLPTAERQLGFPHG
jgi:DNA mismatch repair ATPase MutL